MDINLDVFFRYESQVRSYCRSFPTIFEKAKGSYLYDETGREYLDFFCGAGSVNYGHNNPLIKESVMRYLGDDGVIMGLDFHTSAKKEFIHIFHDHILEPRGLDYKLQFTSPTGTSVVESAIKLARKITDRENIITFTNAYHGMTGVSLSLTGNRGNRQAISYGSVTRLPYDSYLGEGIDAVAYYRKLLRDNSSGVDIPAAIILETVQGEGGINVASEKWLQDVRQLAKECGALLIVDDVQAGCGRTGKFFSFERAGIQPDIVCLSKSIGGIGFPMALLLIKEEYDVWRAGEDNGTFRGNNIAFVAASRMLELYWKDFGFEQTIAEKAAVVKRALLHLFEKYPNVIASVRGIGLMQGIEFFDEQVCSAVTRSCFKRGLIIETSGARDQVLKLMPALTTEHDNIQKGLEIIGAALSENRANAGKRNQVSAGENALA